MIDKRIAQCISDFALFPSWEEKYEHLISLGQSLPMLDDMYKKDAYLIRGCQSQVWFRGYEKNGTIFFEGDSDALITKGIVALLIFVFSGATPKEIKEANMDFLDTIELRSHLSLSRANGLSSMINHMKAFSQRFI